jgi:hypothetical protein
VVEKFLGLAGRKLPPARLENIVARIWNIENDGDWPALFDELRI